MTALRMVVMDDEAALVEKASAGDADAFVRLVQSYDADMRALAYSMTGSASSMDDVLQDAYLKAFRSLHSFKSNASFKTWLWRIVHNVAVDDNRRTGRVVLMPDTSSHVNEAQQQVDVPLRLDINSALQQLSPEHRAVVLLIDGEGHDYQAAAELLGIPMGTVSSRINHARKVLRELLAISNEDDQQ